MKRYACFALIALLAACDGGDADPRPPGPDAAAPLPDAAAPPVPDAAVPLPDAGPPPRLHNPVDLDDFDLAEQATRLLGTSKASCSGCHSLTRALLRNWRDLGETSLTTCLVDPSVATPASAKAMLDCLRIDPQDPRSPFVTKKLGPYSSAAHLDWFEFVFQRAYGNAWEAAYNEFKQRVLMPKGSHPPFTQAQFDVVIEWFERGLPAIEFFVPDVPPPAGCTDSVTPQLKTHVTAMKQSGWGAVNAEHHLLMHGCSGAKNALGCLTSYPRAAEKSYGVGWESLAGAKLRVLRELPYLTSYWTRSSADGRFVAHGGSADEGVNGAAIVDLQENRSIPTNAMFDPGFFPDNSGFVFQGAGASFCAHSVLTSSPQSLKLDEPGCTNTDKIGLYQHVGAALGGGDYWVVDSNFASDDGGKDVTIGDPVPFFGSDAWVNLTPMVHTGNQYQPGTARVLETPYEGDTVISPSSRLLVSRLAGPDNTMRGYVVRQVTGSGPNVEAPEVARYCLRGGKPGFSFDERWMITHHYAEDADAVELGFTGVNDPAFQPYRQKGVANLYLIDLVSGERTRITRMQPGQYALFPHFRSDGWIYFVVRTPGTNGEIVVASDAALVLAAK